MFDTYIRRARFYPAVIAAAPAFAFAAVFVPWNSFGLPHMIASGAMAILLFAMSDVARRQGRAIEPKLLEEMGGLPTLTMMRYRDNAFDLASKKSLHEFVGKKIGAKPPSIESENNNPMEADEFYRRCGDWLRENTRDQKRFKILFEENMTYGFRRNLLGLKWPAIFLNLIIVGLCFGILWSLGSLNINDVFSQKLICVVAIAILHALYMFLFVTKAGVSEASRTYARQLLLSWKLLTNNANK